MRILILAFSIVLLAAVVMSGQNDRIDSLAQVLELEEDVDRRVRLVVELASAWQTQNVDTALGYANMAVDLAERTSSPYLKAEAAATLAYIYVTANDLDKAAEYYQEARNQYVAANDHFESNRCQMLLGNIAYIYYQQNQVDKALDKYISIVPHHLKNERWADLASVYTDIAQIHRDEGNIDKAVEYTTMALNILENNQGNFAGPSSKIESKVFLTAAEISAMSGEFQNAIEYSKRSLALALPNSYKAFILKNARLLGDAYFTLGNRDSSLYYHRMYLDKSDLLDEGRSIADITKLRLQNEFDAKLQEAELENLKETARHKQRETVYIASVIFALMLIALLTLLFVNQKKKISEARLRRKNLELEQEKLRQEVEYKNKELALNMMYLAEKSEFISEIGRALESLKSDAKRENRQLIQQVINQLKKNSDTNAWEEFEMRFVEVHEEFYEALNSAYPGLTPNEKRLCAFLRMNMTTKEISALTHQSVKSINMARFRLRKKMNMEQDENLISFLENL